MDTTVTSLQEPFLCGLDSVAHYEQDHEMQLKAPLHTVRLCDAVQRFREG